VDQKDNTMTPASTSNRARIIFAALVLILGAFWRGARVALATHQRRSLAFGGSSDAKSIAQRDRALTTTNPSTCAFTARLLRRWRISSPKLRIRFFYGPVPVEGAGSGFVIDARGYILTTSRRRRGAVHRSSAWRSIPLPAKFIGADQRNDVALGKIDPKGNTSLRCRWRFGSAPGWPKKSLRSAIPSVSSPRSPPALSARSERTVQTQPDDFIDEAIQTDAAINRGNSGGPLINTHAKSSASTPDLHATGTTAVWLRHFPSARAKNMQMISSPDGPRSSRFSRRGNAAGEWLAQ